MHIMTEYCVGDVIFSVLQLLGSSTLLGQVVQIPNYFNDGVSYGANITVHIITVAEGFPRGPYQIHIKIFL